MSDGPRVADKVRLAPGEFPVIDGEVFPWFVAEDVRVELNGGSGPAVVWVGIMAHEVVIEK